jgi:hypothetical protein
VPEFEDCLRQAMAIRGALGASLIDHVSGMTVASVGREPGAGRAGLTGPAEVARATVDGAAFAPLTMPGHVEDIVITAANGYHLLHFVVLPEGSVAGARRSPRSSDSASTRQAFGARLVLYLWLDRLLGNLAMTQRSLRAIGHAMVAG